ncbi:MAG: DUF4433 domain-containing protein, partial [candidate division Zixibacteria bacterium]|nr:DUF4433 domain-containing protein [candidate division Zixibacteria bacterium]
VEIGEDAKFLNSLPFEIIYHNLLIDQGEDKTEIKFRRHAEVIVPNSCNLDALKWIVCRSEAELETLINLLGEKTKRFKVVQDRRLFECKWTYITRVDLSNSRIKIYLNTDTRTPGPFDLTIEVWSLIAQGSETKRISDFHTTRSPIVLNFRKSQNAYGIRVELDDHLAFQGQYREQV